MGQYKNCRTIYLLNLLYEDYLLLLFFGAIYHFYFL